jgi:hypothetical protein
MIYEGDEITNISFSWIKNSEGRRETHKFCWEQVLANGNLTKKEMGGLNCKISFGIKIPSWEADGIGPA